MFTRFIVDFPIKNGDFRSFFVCLPEVNYWSNMIQTHGAMVIPGALWPDLHEHWRDALYRRGQSQRWWTDVERRRGLGQEMMNIRKA